MEPRVWAEEVAAADTGNAGEVIWYSFKEKAFFFHPIGDREPLKGFFQQGSNAIIFKNSPSADSGFKDNVLSGG